VAARAERAADAATVTLVVGASGIAPFNVGASFWALLAGLAFSATRSGTRLGR